MPDRVEYRRHHRRRNLRSRFDIIRTLGQGTYGKVKLAIERETGEAFAIKSIRKKQIGSEKDLARLRRELEIMSSLNHPHIISVYEVFENSDKIILVMEYASGGELYDYCNDKRGLYDDEARKFFRQIVSAVHYMHMNGIVHRDLKLENIVLDHNGDVKIADFGFANICSSDILLSTFCGSPLYASPEIVNGLPYHGPEVDCWSLGVLLYAIVYGAMPFDGSDFRRLRNQITNGDYFKPSRVSDASTLISRLLCPDNKHRAKIQNIANHWWINVGYDCSPVVDLLPVDRQKLIHKLSGASSEESDCDVVLDANVHQNSDHQNINQTVEHQTFNHQSTECDHENTIRAVQHNDANITPPIKGILKKPKDSSHAGKHENCRLMRSRSLDIDLKFCDRSVSEPVAIEHKHSYQSPETEILGTSAPGSSAIFDSARRPKKSILKNSHRYYKGADSGCVMDDSMEMSIHEKDMFQTDESLEVDWSEISQHDSESEVPIGDSSDLYDLNDIEAVLDSIMSTSGAICDETPETQDDVLGSPNPSHTEDSGIADVSSPEKSPEVEASTSHSKYCSAYCGNHVPTEGGDMCTKSSDIMMTSTPASHTLISGRRKKGILKHNTKFPDPAWRLSTGSQGSTSSGDILDFSYDSGEGETFLSEYFTMPLSTQSEASHDCRNLSPNFEEYDNVDLSGLDLSNDSKNPNPITDEDCGQPPPLPEKPPPDCVHYTLNGNGDLLADDLTHTFIPTSGSSQQMPYNNGDILEKILWLANEDLERKSSKEPAVLHHTDWDEVEDIYRKALELQSEWS